MLYNFYQFFKDLNSDCWRTMLEQKRVELDGGSVGLEHLKRMEALNQQKREHPYTGIRIKRRPVAKICLLKMLFTLAGILNRELVRSIVLTFHLEYAVKKPVCKRHYTSYYFYVPYSVPENQQVIFVGQAN